MSPSAITELAQQTPESSLTLAHPTNGKIAKANGSLTSNGMKRTVFLLDRHLHKDFPVIVSGKGNLLYTKDGRTVFDATSGAAVSCLGHGYERITNAVNKQMKTGIPYLCSGFWGCEIVDDLCKELIDGTGGKMARVYLTGSGWSFKLKM